MAAFILILGLLQMAGGIASVLTAQSAVHETVAALLFGFGVVSMGIAVIIAKIDDAVKALAPSAEAAAPEDNVQSLHRPRGSVRYRE